MRALDDTDPSISTAGPRQYHLSYDPDSILGSLSPEIWAIAETLVAALRVGEKGAFTMRKDFDDHPSGVGLCVPMYVLDHIATGRTLYSGTDAGCTAVAASLETMPVDWTKQIEPEHLTRKQQEFCARAIASAVTGTTLDWAECV